MKWEQEVLEQRFEKVESDRDGLQKNFVGAISEVLQKANFKKLLLERKVLALADSLEKKDAQLNEILAASNLDPAALSGEFYIFFNSKLISKLQHFFYILGFTNFYS